MGSSRRSLTFREAGIRDTKKVIQLCETWWYDSAWFKKTQMPFESTPEYWYALFQAGVIIATVGEDENGDVKAAYVAVKQPYMFNHSYNTASEVVWCLDKEYRTGPNLVNLLQSIEDVCKKHEIHIYNLNIPVDENKEKLADSLVKRGFFKQDLSLFKEMNNG
jgi:hypothetical protein